MIRTSEWVSPAHPDKLADYVSSCLLDRYLKEDPGVHFAVETMIKDNIVTLGGEISSDVDVSDEEICGIVRKAVNDIGYTEEYQKHWGRENTICGDEMEVYPLIGRQSPDIGCGVDAGGWGDQGIFWGMAVDRPANDYLPRDYFLARKLGRALYDGGPGGLDIKTLVTMEDGNTVHVTVAVPLLDDGDADRVAGLARRITGCRDVTVNGTGRYVRHSTLADCGVTGRKLVVDQYGGNCRIGGGAPWGKDGGKADVTLTLHARRLAMEFMRKAHVRTVFCSVSCSIGSPEIDVCYMDGSGRELKHERMTAGPAELVARYGLDRPVFAEMCRKGLFHAVG